MDEPADFRVSRSREFLSRGCCHLGKNRGDETEAGDHTGQGDNVVTRE